MDAFTFYGGLDTDMTGANVANAAVGRVHSFVVFRNLAQLGFKINFRRVRVLVFPRDLSRYALFAIMIDGGFSC